MVHRIFLYQASLHRVDQSVAQTMEVVISVRRLHGFGTEDSSAPAAAVMATQVATDHQQTAGFFLPHNHLRIDIIINHFVEYK